MKIALALFLLQIFSHAAHAQRPTFMDSIVCLTLSVPHLKEITGAPFAPLLTDSSGANYELTLLPGYQPREWHRCKSLILYYRLTGCKTPVYADEVDRYYIAPAGRRKP